MSRRVKLPTKEVGELQLFLINQTGTQWEIDWRPLQGHLIANLLTVISKDTMEAALLGATSSLVKQLGLPPEGAIRKLPLIHQACAHRKTCGVYMPFMCVPQFKKMPVCFDPDGVEGDQARQLASAVIQYWREKVYVVVVVEDE